MQPYWPRPGAPNETIDNKQMTENTHTNSSSSKKPDCLNAVILAVSAGVGVFLVFAVFLYAKEAPPLIDALVEISPEVVLQNGKFAEETAKPGEAVFFYRKALALGLKWPPTREDCVMRLTALLQEQGRNRDLPVCAVNQLLGNGDFEADLTRVWREGLPPLDTIPTDSLERISGRRSVLVPANKDDLVALRQEINLVAGESYRVTCWLRTLNLGAPGVAVGMEGRTGNQSSLIARTDYVHETKEWSQLAAEFIAPPGFEKFAFVVLRGRQDTAPPDAEKQRIWLDACGIERTGKELLKNGSLECEKGVPAFWRQSQNTTPVPDQTCRVEGRNSLRFELADADNLGFWQTVPVEPGETYELTGWIRTSELAEPGARLEVQDGTGWQKWVKTGEAVTGTADWQKLTILFTVPEETPSLSVLLRKPRASESQTQARGTVWFDALSLRKTGETILKTSADSGSIVTAPASALVLK